MKYENGKDIFPEQLLRQIQKYVTGKLVYIPSENKREWGEASGYRQYLLCRNRDIRNKFNAGILIEQLANEYCLSYETIRKIVYSKEEKFIMEYKCCLSCAKDYAKNGKLEEWVHEYLLSDGHNKPFSDGLKIYDRYFFGPIKMPLSLFNRCCGPEENMKYRVDAIRFELKVKELSKVIQDENDMPPIIVHYMLTEGSKDGEFELNDGNHRFEAYKRLGINEAYVIIWITEEHERNQFIEKYGMLLNE